LRLFIATLIPEDIRTLLTNYIKSLKRDIDGVKWEKSEKLHVTLKFLGDVDDSKVEEIPDLLRKLVRGYSPFNINISDFGGFPNLKNPRVLYVSLSENEELSGFQSELDEGLSDLGFKKEDRKFIPHVTIGRVKKRIFIKEYPRVTQNPFEITKIGLIKSELRPEGSVYTPLKLFKLEK
jgi:2'-5' RNA ligase